MTRQESIAKMTGGKVEWYTSHKQMVRAELENNVVWDGNENYHKPAPEGKLVTAKTGSVGRQIGDRVYALTASECEKLGVAAGPANN